LNFFWFAIKLIPDLFCFVSDKIKNIILKIKPIFPLLLFNIKIGGNDNYNQKFYFLVY